MSEWISVSSAIPENETESCSIDCRVLLDDGTETDAYRYLNELNWDNENEWFDIIKRKNITNVTHWMPLPEPPKQNEDIEVIPMPGEATPVVASKRFEERSGRMTDTND